MCITRFWEGAIWLGWLGATRGLAMLPSNHAIHDNNYGGLYNFNFVARLGIGTTPEQGRDSHAFSCHLCGRPAALDPSELERVFLVPARHPSCREKRLLVFSSLSFFFFCFCPGTRHLAPGTWHIGLLVASSCLDSETQGLWKPRTLSFFVVQAYEANRVPCRSLLPAQVPPAAILDCQHSSSNENSMAFRHRHRQSEFAPSILGPLSPFNPCR